MRTVKLLSWHEDFASKAKALTGKGSIVDASPLERTSRAVSVMAHMNPAAIVLDMDRLPSNCRAVALMLRSSRSARHIPILCAGVLPPDGDEGLPAKYSRLKSELPDIPYAAWPNAAKVLASLLDRPATKPPVVPPLREYTTSLAQKLGIVSASAKAKDQPRSVAIVAAPDGFIDSLGELPQTLNVVPKIGQRISLAICFIRSLGELAATLEILTYKLPEGASAWIAYPKRGRGRAGEFNENHIRNIGLAAGFVDYKICSIDDAWSGIKFARRKS